MEKIYFDHASTTPVDAQVVSAMLPFFTEKFGNPSSTHSFGLAAQKSLEDSRGTVAKFLGAQSKEIIFTGSGTEANNLALLGAARSLKNKGNHIIVSAIEHPSVLETAHYIEKEGFRVTYLAVDHRGQISLDELWDALSDQTILVSIMHANNEIGTLQPIAQIGRRLREKNIIFHVDAVQTVGHLPVDVKAFSIDLLSLSAHKFYGPKGIGALYVRNGVVLQSLLLGGNQENGLRASTQSVAGAVGLAAALRICQNQMAQEALDQARLRDFLIEEVLKRIDGVRLNGHPTQRLANNAHFVFKKIKGSDLLVSLDQNGIAASMGSACKAGVIKPSSVLQAIGLTDELALGALRISLGRTTIKAQVEYLIEQLVNVVKTFRR